MRKVKKYWKSQENKRKEFDSLNELKGLSAPLKIVALFFGFMVFGPFIALLLSHLF